MGEKLQNVVASTNLRFGTCAFPRKRKRDWLDWLVEKFRPGYHIARNPPKGGKKARKGNRNV